MALPPPPQLLPRPPGPTPGEQAIALESPAAQLPPPTTEPQVLDFGRVHMPKPPPPGHHAFQKYKDQFPHLYEVYVDDYVGLVQSSNRRVLRHHSRALLHAIHQIFPPVPGEDKSDDPISYKKLVLEGEGIWDTRKELLGWIFDGMERTLELPPRKVADLRETIKIILRNGYCERKHFESLVGKCNHAALGIPGGSALLPPLYQALHAPPLPPTIRIGQTSRQHQALTDLRAMFKVMSRTPTKCSQLVPGKPAYIGYTDACKYGAGGVWLSGTKTIRPIVWRIKWPPEVVQAFEEGKTFVNELEMAGLLISYLVLEMVVPMRDTHSALWCDNSSTVSWTGKMNSGKSQVGQQLTRALAFRLCAPNKASPLVPLPIQGRDNYMADLSSRSFKAARGAGNYNLTDVQFLTKFNADFPLQQKASWLMLQLHTRITSLVCTLLCNGTLPVGSWLRLKKFARDIGSIGRTSASQCITWTPFSPMLASKLKLTSSRVLPDMYVKGMQAEEIRSAQAQSKQRLAPSARPSNWTIGGTSPMSRAPTESSTSP